MCKGNRNRMRNVRDIKHLRGCVLFETLRIQKDRKVMSKLPDWEFFVISRFFQGKQQ